MLSIIARLLRVLNSGTEPGQISLSICLSMVAGLTPLFSPHNLPVLFIVLILKVNLSAFLLGLAFFSGIAYILDPLFHIMGLKILTASSLEGLWTTLYNSTFWRFTRFNNTIVMGSLVFSLLSFAPLYILSNFIIRRYREHVLEWVLKTRLMQAFTATRLYKLYSAYSGMKGGS